MLGVRESQTACHFRVKVLEQEEIPQEVVHKEPHYRALSTLNLTYMPRSSSFSMSPMSNGMRLSLVSEQDGVCFRGPRHRVNLFRMKKPEGRLWLSFPKVATEIFLVPHALEESCLIPSKCGVYFSSP